MKWYFITAVLCVYGFFKEFRPVEPFLTPYLESPLKNFTDDQLNSQVYPYWTYSYLIVLIPTFILTDLLRYKPVIFLEGLTYAATWILLIWGDTVGQMQLMQTFYGFATATEIAYFAYIFAAVDSAHYKKATSYVKAAIELGDFFAYGLSQLLIYIYGNNYQLLNYISLGSCILIVPLALSLPWISYKKPLEKSETQIRDADAPETYCEFVKKYFVTLWLNFRNIYSTAFMWKWSLWWALATCGFLQVGNYIQNLWAVMQSGDGEQLNGVVEAVNTFLCKALSRCYNPTMSPVLSIVDLCFSACVVVVCMQFVTVRWEIWGEVTLAIVSGIDCALLVVMSQTSLIGLVYAFYIAFTLIYQMMFTIGM